MNNIAIIGGPDGPTAIYMTGDTGIVGEMLNLCGGADKTALWMYAAITVVIVLAAYFIGNISPSTILAKKQGIDIKKEGSGNAGTTNALRVMGKKAGAVTLIIDVLKGLLSVVLAGLLCGQSCAMFCVIAVMLGHIWPVLYKFKGGKGVATAFGAVAGLNILVALCALGVLIVGVLISKRMSVGSMLAALSFPVFCWFLEPDFIYLACVLALVIIIKHRANLVRLLHGEEPKLSFFDKEKRK